MENSKKPHYFLKIFLITLISLLFVELTFKLIAFKSLFGLELVRIFIFSITASLIVAFISTLFKRKLCKVIVSIFIFWASFYAVLQLTFYNLLNNYMSLNASTGGGLSRVVSQIPFIAVLIIFIF